MKLNETKVSSNDDFLLVMSSANICFDDYNVEKYLNDVKTYGLEDLWAHILDFVKKEGCTDFLKPTNFGAMYEAGLAEQDKNDKKKSGQYFTPNDVSDLMAQWLVGLKGDNICDVGCGTGNLILSYLKIIGEEKVIRLLKNRKIYLYDFDKIALTIAKHSIAIIYGYEYFDNINTIYGDFLDDSILLPDNSKIITNPPYSKFDRVQENWSKSTIQITTKELYAAFMEKIIISKNPAVIISPYSFLGGNKFFELRKLMNEFSGFIVAFDNVPGNIFNGRKHGIFNTNTANSVRAAITVVENNYNDNKGFKTTHLIRFKNEERLMLLKNEILSGLLSDTSRVVSSKNKMYPRLHVQLEPYFNEWVSKSTKKVEDILSKEETNWVIYMPNTCRYFTTGSKKKLNRGGFITLNTINEDLFNYLYCMINSSLTYWWWRVYDGGITYPISLLNSMPIFFDLLNQEDKDFFADIAGEMISLEDEYTTTKANAGHIQENIKFPKKYRDKINSRMIKILKGNIPAKTFDLVHKNSHFEELKEAEENE